MHRLALVAALLVGAASLADIPPPDSRDCRDKSKGAACTTDSGAAGTCTEVMVGRPDYSSGFPPKARQVPMLLCRATGDAGASAKAVAPSFGPWALAALGALAAGAVLWRNRRLA